MSGHSRNKSGGATEPLPPWAVELPRADRRACSNDHSGQRVQPFGSIRVIENTQGQLLVAPLDYCGTCFRQVKLARQRHDEHIGSVRQRNLDAQALMRALEMFESTTGVDLKPYVLVAEGRFWLGAKQVEELARALDVTAETKVVDSLPEEPVPLRMLAGNGPLARVLSFRRVPTA